MWYAKKETNGNWTNSQEIQFEGSFPVVTTKEIPVFEILVFDSENQQWIEDSTLESAYTIKKAKEDALAWRLKKQDFGSKFLATVVELNVSKFLAGTLNQSDLTAMDTDATLQAMERAAWRGNLTTLKALVQSYSSTYYTTGEKLDLVALIDASGLV